MNFKLQITELLALDQHLVHVENDGNGSVLTQASVSWERKTSEAGVVRALVVVNSTPRYIGAELYV